LSFPARRSREVAAKVARLISRAGNKEARAGLARAFGVSGLLPFWPKSHFAQIAAMGQCPTSKKISKVGRGLLASQHSRRLSI
jgi:hypothetical protein